MKYWLSLAERTTDALVDPKRRDHAMAALLAGFTLAFALYAAISRSNMDVSPDTGELIAWMRDQSFMKHPPMSVWVARGWLWIFPVADWSMHLLATTTAALTLWICWRLFSDWLDAEKAVVGIAMLMLVPLYTFHALLFNANTVMMPFWAAATLLFLRSVKTRSLWAAVLAGAAGAGALLGKFWSAYLVAGLALAAVLDVRRKSYFSSPAPWLAAATGAILVTPYLVSLSMGGTGSLTYILSVAGSASTNALASSARYLGESIGYVIVPLLAFAATRPSRLAIHDTFRPADADRLLALAVLTIPLLLPALVNLALPSRPVGVWTIPNWTLLPVVLLASPLVIVTRRFVVGIVALALALPVGALAAAPIVAMVSHHNAARGPQAHFRELARTIEALWRMESERPAGTLMGEHGLAYGAAFYLRDPVRVVPYFIPDARLERDGVVRVCRAATTDCVAALDRFGRAANVRRHEVELTRTHFGRAGRPIRYVIEIVPPAAAQ